ncbi:MAG: hypothetical protein QG650_905 [Patescibacteria group bacterium]|nr:hypothetical protein [Patescibacteria group bacterium]
MSNAFFNTRKSAILVLAASVSALSIPSAFAETGTVAPPAIGLSAIVRNGTDYDLFVKNRPDDATDIRIYEGTVEVPNAANYLSGGTVRMKNVLKSWAKLSVERWGNKTAEDGVRSKVKESLSSGITVASPERTYLKNDVRRNVVGDTAVYVIPVQFAKDQGELAFSGASRNDSALRTKYAISMGSGEDIPLEIGSSSTSYQPKRAYVTPEGIVVRQDTLPDEYNRVTLKADGVPLNFVTVRKQAEILGELVDTSISMESGEAQVVLRFQNARGIKDLTLYEFKINNQIPVPEVNGTGSKNTVSTGFGSSGPITLRIKPNLLGTGETVARVVVKEKNSSLYDSKTVDLSDILFPKITAVKTVPSGAVTNFQIDVNPVSLYGDYEKIDIDINGTAYTARGVKTAVKNADGTVKKDIQGNETYEFVNRIDFKKTSAGLEFSFPSDKLKESGNTIKIKNGNSGQESGTLTFSPGKAAGSESASSVATKEAVSFQAIPSNVPSYDPVLAPSREVSLGNLLLGNLDPSAYYRITAKFSIAGTFNPFSTAKAGSSRIVTDGGTTETVFEITEEGAGKTISKSIPVSVGLSDFLASEKALSMEWKSIKLEKAKDGQWTTAASAEAAKGSILQTVKWGNCFDGSTDVCGKDGMPEESKSSVIVTFGSVAVAKTEEKKPVATTTKTGKKNDPWRLAVTAGNGPIGKILNAKLGASFAKLKDKHAADPKKRAKLQNAKKAVERALSSAKKYEETKAKAMKDLLKKTLIKDLKDAMKKMSDASK